MELVEKAKEIAEISHKGQVRKTDGSPYILHPIAVSKILEENNFSEAVVSAGLLHDVIEDTGAVESEIREKLGDEVADIVVAVSEDKNLPWEDRKMKYVEQVLNSGEAAWAVSIADKIHNAESLIEFHKENGESTWEKFNRGKDKKIWFEKKLYNRLKEVWKHPLLDRYCELIEQMEVLK